MVYSLAQFMPEEQIATFCREHYVRKLSVFGSAQRGELRPDSDIDLLVEFHEGHVPGLFELARMEIALTNALGRKVDLRTPLELSRYFRDDVLQKAALQYEEA